MKNISITIILLISVLFFGCKLSINTSGEEEENQEQVNYYPLNQEGTLTKVKGQIFYNYEEIMENRENDPYMGYEYDLYNFRVYLISGKRAYRIPVSHDGNFSSTEVLPGSYSVIIKTKEYFSDSEGEYTYMFTVTADVYEGAMTDVGLINPVKTYLEKPEASKAEEDIQEAERTDKIEEVEEESKEALEESVEENIEEEENDEKNDEETIEEVEEQEEEPLVEEEEEEEEEEENV